MKSAKSIFAKQNQKNKNRFPSKPPGRNRARLILRSMWNARSHRSARVHHFFLPPPLSDSSFFSQEITFPNMTTPLPSINATRDKPSQFLEESQTSGCCGWNDASAISFDFNAWGSSIFLPPVSYPSST